MSRPALLTLTQFSDAHQPIDTSHGTWCSCGRWCGLAANAHKTHLADALLLDPEATDAARRFLKAVAPALRRINQALRATRPRFTEVS